MLVPCNYEELLALEIYTQNTGKILTILAFVYNYGVSYERITLGNASYPNLKYRLSV